MSMLSHLNRAQRRKFNKLPKEEQRNIVALELSNKVREETNYRVSKAFVDGFMYSQKVILEKYWNRFNEAADKEKLEIAEELFKEIKDRQKEEVEDQCQQ